MQWDGKTYEWDPEEIDVQQAIVIKMAFGWTLKQWQEALAEVDPQAFQALFWLMRTQNKEACNLTDQNFSINKFAEVFQAAAEEAKAREEVNRGNDETPSLDGNIPGLAMT